MRIALIGSTGLVGQAIVNQIEVTPFCSRTIDGFDPTQFDICLLATPADISRKLAAKITPHCKVIDNSSAFRLDPNVPLVIPEINGHLIDASTRLIASPNCVATILLMALYPLHTAFGATRLIGSTYQAASGGGKKLIDRLFADTKSALAMQKPTDFGLNLFLHETAEEEEKKACAESQKILQTDLPMSLTCVRVPTLSSHAISLHIAFEQPFALEEAVDVLNKAPGITLAPITPREAMGKKEVFCSRIRKDPCDPRALELWLVGDQLMRGSSYNVIRILDLVMQRQSPSHPQWDGEKKGALA